MNTPPTQAVNKYCPPAVNARKKTDNTLKGYIKTVATLECQIWNQNRLINKLNTRASYLGKPKKIEKPDISDSYKLEDGTGVIISLFAALLPAALVAASLDFFGGLGFLLSLAALALCLFLFASIFYKTVFIGLQKFLAKSTHRQKMNHYNTATDAEQKRMQREQRLKQEISQQIESVKAERQRTQNALNSLYALSIIHPAYQHKLVAITSFYDYFDKGICTKLEGRDGAYAFYEEELRFGRLESKLDIIIEKLDAIAANQQFLASMIRSGNAALHRIEHQNSNMLTQLNSISENTAVTAYNTQCCAESMSVMESLSIYRYLKH